MIVGEEGILIKPLYLVLMKNNLGNVKQCKTLIKHLHVKVNGQVMNDSSYMVSYDDVIIVDDHLICSQPYHYIMLNKPKGYVSAHHDKQYPCVIDLINEKQCQCVGRLDKDTTGLLLLSDDPSLIKRVLLPNNHIKKVYYVTVLNPLKKEDKEKFQEGVLIDQCYKCLPSDLDIIDSYHCYVTIYEGRYHQIKKMFLSLSNQVLELERVSFHQLQLDSSLKRGKYRYLTDEEIESLWK